MRAIEQIGSAARQDHHGAHGISIYLIVIHKSRSINVSILTGQLPLSYNTHHDNLAQYFSSVHVWTFILTITSIDLGVEVATRVTPMSHTRKYGAIVNIHHHRNIPHFRTFSSCHMETYEGKQNDRDCIRVRPHHREKDTLTWHRHAQETTDGIKRSILYIVHCYLLSSAALTS